MLQSYIINSTDNRHDLNTVGSVLGVVPTTYEKVTENLNEDEGFESKNRLRLHMLVKMQS